MEPHVINEFPDFTTVENKVFNQVLVLCVTNGRTCFGDMAFQNFFETGLDRNVCFGYNKFTIELAYCIYIFNLLADT